ncbi:uncharacterized protein LOC127808520 [Diospyros lotus]|uniref:uncharacterized protein LOC127808520 n=1 Tax=Diospyros lotus TaxID=55363 RepID=UPI00224EF9F0|nr:uncharacterized protein LOC127808520 [Diospyros lotus]
MTIALSVKNKLGFINGTIVRPSGDITLLNAWIRSKNIVISWILNSVSKEISTSLIYSESAFDIWNDLKDRFQQSNGPRIFQLRREMMNLNQGQLSVSAYFTRLKAVWDELNNFRPICTCGKCSCGGTKSLADHYHMEYVMSFLMGLNDSYAQIRGQLLLMDPLPLIKKVFALISQEENKRAVLNGNGNDSALFSVKHEATRSNFSKSQRKERSVCTHCGYNGHTIEKCYKLHGYPPGYKPRQRNNMNQSKSNQINSTINQVNGDGTNQVESQDMGNFMQSLTPTQYQNLLSMLSTHLSDVKIDADASKTPDQASGICLSTNIASSLGCPRFWIIDSGATSHICYDCSSFHQLRPIQNAFVTLPDHRRFSVSFIGNVKLSPYILLENVLYIPQFKFNLISVSALAAHSSLYFRFLSDSCIIQDLCHSRMIGKAEHMNGLYVIDSDSLVFDKQSDDRLCNSDEIVAHVVSKDIWHNRLGHLAFEKLDMLSELLNFPNNKRATVPCSICPLAK